jgi:hypothetical protein
MTYLYARFNLYFAPDMCHDHCHLDFRLAHMASIDELSRHPRLRPQELNSPKFFQLLHYYVILALAALADADLAGLGLRRVKLIQMENKRQYI